MFPDVCQGSPELGGHQFRLLDGRAGGVLGHLNLCIALSGSEAQSARALAWSSAPLNLRVSPLGGDPNARFWRAGGSIGPMWVLGDEPGDHLVSQTRNPELGPPHHLNVRVLHPGGEGQSARDNGWVGPLNLRSAFWQLKLCGAVSGGEGESTGAADRIRRGAVVR